jgi:hypothetical protein
MPLGVEGKDELPMIALIGSRLPRTPACGARNPASDSAPSARVANSGLS